jgi:hypothetical protein
MDTKEMKIKEFTIPQLMLFLHEKNKYDEDTVLLQLSEKLKTNSSINYLRLRKTGIDCISAIHKTDTFLINKYISLEDEELIKIK